jgi:hypothetical protein
MSDRETRCDPLIHSQCGLSHRHKLVVGSIVPVECRLHALYRLADGALGSSGSLSLPASIVSSPRDAG